MSGRLPTQPAEVFARRRAALRDRLGARPVFVFAGGSRPRNYPHNPYPYRAESHFLYFVGASLPDAVLMMRGDRTELFVVPEGPDDALWHGATPSLQRLAEATGVDRVRPLAEMRDEVHRDAATIPSVDLATRLRQRALFGRPWPDIDCPSLEALTAGDRALADAVVALRLRHDEAAIAHVRTAVEATTAAHLAGMAATAPGGREHEVRAAMERELIARGCDPAYGSIVTVHGEVLHNNAYDNALAVGDLLLADLGAEHEGWASDVTRTWPVSGRFTPTQRAIYDIVLQANLDAIAAVAPGVRYRDVHLTAARTIARGLVDEGVLKGDPDTLVERGAHAIVFPHGVGHLLGLDVHDMEDLGDRAGYAPGRIRSPQFGLGYLRLDRDLEPGMIVTIEPGFYRVPAILEHPEIAGPFVADGTLDRDALARFGDVRGIRIEDDVLCTPTGREVLTAAIPKDAAAVEQHVGSGAASESGKRA